MSEIVELDQEIEVLRKKLVKLRRQRENKMKVATLQVQIQKAKMEARLPELLTTPFLQELRKLLIKSAENHFVAAFRKAALEAVKKAGPSTHPNPVVI